MIVFTFVNAQTKNIMNTLSFYYEPSQVYRQSIRALHRRRFQIVEVDEARGIIRASISKGLLKAGIDLELLIKQENENQTTLNINSTLKKTWLTPDNYNEAVEKKFINTLYNCFNKI